MNIILLLILPLFGASVTAAMFYRRERNMVLMQTRNQQSVIDQQSFDYANAQRTIYDIRREADYWRGIAHGEKAEKIYDMALQSVKDGSGFAYIGKSFDNVSTFPTM